MTAPQQPAGTARAELSDAAVVSRSWGMALATLVSRLTGFARIVLLAAILGAALSSAFSVANQLPNMIAALVLEATFTAIFVPVLARAERDDPDGGEAFVRRLVTLATTVLVVATTLSIIAAPLLVRLMLGSDPQVNQPLTTAFAYLLLPQVIFYGLSSVFMAILNNRNVFGPPAWAPVINNIVAIATLGLYLIVPGELSVNPVEMGNAKLLVLGVGTTLGVVAQAAVLLIAIRAERISLRPLLGIDARLRRFGTMAAAMVLYVLISQLGLVVSNQIASTAAASGPAIYNYTWMVLMLPFGIIGVTVLTVVMPRLSRNAAADDLPAVRADLSLATRLTMVTLIPVVALMTVAGPAIGSALFAYGNFGSVDAGYLGRAIALSAFTLIPYALVLVQLRVFYAREQPWTPILIIVAITVTKIAASLAAPHLTADPELVAGYLGTANGLGFLVGAILGHLLLRRSLGRPSTPVGGGGLLDAGANRTIVVTLVAATLAGLTAAGLDRLLGLAALTDEHGGAGSMLRLIVLAAIMAPIVAGVLLAARVPDALAARVAVSRRLGRVRHAPAQPSVRVPVTYPDSGGPSAFTEPRTAPVRIDTGKGPQLSDQPPGTPPEPTASGPTEHTGPTGQTGRVPRHAADDFQPDVRPGPGPDVSAPPVRSGARHAARADTVPVPGGSVAEGRYRLLVFHGGPPGLQFWQARDTALGRPVALTLIDPEGRLPDAELEAILGRTLKLSRIERPGLARILDVTTAGSGGLVVAEWIRGGSLKEVADTSPSAMGGARAVQSLATAAEEAHQAGVALSIDHPSRIRVSVEGDVVLAFPATTAAATPEDDVRGIGAALYALLVDRWPLPETGTPSGLAPTTTDPSGAPIEPHAINAAIPFQISAAAVRAVQPSAGITTAATLANLLRQATAAADRTVQIEPAAPAPPAQPPDEAAALALRRRNLLIGIAAGAAILLVALVVLASLLNRIFGDVGGGLRGDQLGLNTTTPTTTETATGEIVKPVAATVFSPDGGADAPELAGRAIDGDPTTAWPTDTYSDTVPFPDFKNGVGLMLQLPQPTVVGNVSITLSSSGTKVQIRSASTPDPASLESTQELTPPTELKPGSNTIAVPSAAPTSNLLVWISTLGKTAGKNQVDVSEITVRAAS